MKIKFVVTLLALIVTHSVFAQEKKELSIELKYPLPIDNNFIGENYTGIVDLGVKYNLVQKEAFAIGASLHGGLLKSSSSEDSPYRVNAFTIQPEIFVAYTHEKINPFKPYIGVGFTTMLYKSKLDKKFNNGFLESEVSSNQNGFHFNLGTTCRITEQLYIHAQYEFIKLNLSDIPETSYNTNIGLLKLGFGYKI